MHRKGEIEHTKCSCLEEIKCQCLKDLNIQNIKEWIRYVKFAVKTLQLNHQNIIMDMENFVLTNVWVYFAHNLHEIKIQTGRVAIGLIKAKM